MRMQGSYGCIATHVFLSARLGGVVGVHASWCLSHQRVVQLKLHTAAGAACVGLFEPLVERTPLLSLLLVSWRKVNG